MKDAVRSLSGAKTPFIIAGGGAVEGGEALRFLAEKLGAPVAFTSAGKGILPEDHPLCLGARLHFPAVKKLLQESDCLLAVGTELSPTDFWAEEFPAPERMISVDVDDGFVSSRKGIFLKGRCGDVLPRMVEALEKRSGPFRFQKKELLDRCHRDLSAVLGIAEEIPLVMDTVSALGRVLGENGVLWADMTGAAYYAISEYPSFRPRTFLHPVGFGTLGAALPAALGTKCAFPGRRVAALAGDGGFQFTLPELAVGVQEKVCLPIVLWNDGGFGEIRRSQDRKGSPRIAVDHWNPDFRVLARAYGVPYFAPSDGLEVEKALEDAFGVSSPSIIEVKTGKELCS